MKIEWLIPVLSVSILAACESETPPAPMSTAQASANRAAAGEAKGTKLYGAPLTPGEVIPIADVLASADTNQGKTVLTAGHVRKACTKKGCWMELATSANAAQAGCRVTFKDYGFFVPLDSAGSTAKLQGVVEVKQVPKDEVTHMEQEGAKFSKKLADGSALEVRIVASGVELTRAGG